MKIIDANTIRTTKQNKKYLSTHYTFQQNNNKINTFINKPYSNKSVLISY